MTMQSNSFFVVKLLRKLSFQNMRNNRQGMRNAVTDSDKDKRKAWHQNELKFENSTA